MHALVERLFNTDQPYLEALAEDSDRSVIERIQDYVNHLAKFLGKTSGLQPVFLESYARASRDPKVAELVAGFFEEYQRLAEKLLRQGIASGEFPEDTNPKLVSSVLITQIEGCIVIANLTGQRVETLLRRNMGFLLKRL